MISAALLPPTFGNNRSVLVNSANVFTGCSPPEPDSFRRTAEALQVLGEAHDSHY
jgi:hypothetical protein